MLKHRILIILVLVATTGIYVSCSKAPKVEKVEAEGKQVEPGQTVRLVGENFGKDLSKLEVRVDDQPAEVKKIDDQDLEVLMPESSAAGSHKIVVLNKETKAESVPVEVMVVIPSPEINKIEPASVRTGGVLKVEGTHFNPAANAMDAKLGSENVTLSSVTSTSAEISVPEDLAPGKHDLVFTDLKTGKSSNVQQVQVNQLLEIPAGTELHVKTVGEIGSAINQPGDVVALVLATPLASKGTVIASSGNHVTGRVTFVNQPGKVKGRAAIGFTVEKVEFDQGNSLAVQTDDFNSQAASGKKKDTKKILITTGVGTFVGALAGGGKGAAIGAGVGAGAGTALVLSTKGDHVVVPANSRLVFVLRKPVEVELTQPISRAAKED